MVSVFSFVVYGNDKKYTHGLLTNLQLIQIAYPSWQVWIYYGSDVDDSILLQYRYFSNAVLIPTNNTGAITKFFRYFPIDDPSVEVCMVRDADSRVNDRDQVCINIFLKSSRLFHIIRDHPNHYHKIMAGMWGIKKGALSESIHTLFEQWRQHNVFDFWSDTRFLVECIYPSVQSISLIHDDRNYANDGAIHIPHHRIDKHFIGQVYEYNNTGEEYPKFDY
jgi:hypothetical protein